MKYYVILLGQRIRVTAQQFDHFTTWQNDVFVSSDGKTLYVMIYVNAAKPSRRYNPKMFAFLVEGDELFEPKTHRVIAYRRKSKA